MVIYIATMFINGTILTFMFWLGQVPQHWLAGAFVGLGTAAMVSTSITYLMMLNPDWNKNREDLESERIDYSIRIKELKRLRERYLAALEGNNQH